MPYTIRNTEQEISGIYFNKLDEAKAFVDKWDGTPNVNFEPLYVYESNKKIYEVKR